jgi:hypothetical protein
MHRSTLLLLVAVTACIEFDGGKNDDDEDDTSSGEESDADTDSDADADADADADSDLCDDPPPAVDPDGACIVDELTCGGRVTSTTLGGTTRVDGSNYASFWACAVVGTSNYRGPEAMIEFQHPGDGWAYIALDSPCTDLDLFTVRWSDNTCVQDGLSILECDADISAGGGTVSIWNNEPSRYVVIVEGADGQEAPFRVSATCE